MGGAWSFAPGGRRARVEIAHYESRVEDLIIWVPNPPEQLQTDERVERLIRGEECAAHLAGPLGVDLEGR